MYVDTIVLFFPQDSWTVCEPLLWIPRITNDLSTTLSQYFPGNTWGVAKEVVGTGKPRQ